MTKIPRLTALFGIFLALLPLLAACHDENASSWQDAETQQGRRTVLVYMAAQNSLGRGRYHLADSAEIMNGRQAIADDDRLLMMIDDGQAPRLYRVDRHHDQPTLLREWEEDFCSTDPKRLTELLKATKELSPAREYGLVLWSHATGWVPSTDTNYANYESAAASLQFRPFSFGIDSGPSGSLSDRGAQMNMEAIASAVTESGLHLRFLFFDACLMQNVEVAYALRNATDYLIASPGQTPGVGSNYTHQLQSGFFSEDPSQIARIYLTDVVDPNQTYDYYDFGLTIACVRTDRMQAVADALREALPHSTLTNRQSPEMMLPAKPGLTEAQPVTNYQAYCYQYSFRPHNYDALQSIRAILPAAEAERVIAALNEAVIYHGATSRFWIGPGDKSMQTMPTSTDDYLCLSMFIPQTVYTKNATDSNCKYGDLNEAFRQTEWYRAAGFEQTGW